MTFILRLTSALFGLSACLQRRPLRRAVLATAAVASQIFWRAPARGSAAHRVDAVIAKGAIGYFVCDTVRRRPHPSYYGVLAALAACAARSHAASAAQWCGARHVQWHAALHVVCFVASLYAAENVWLLS